MSGGSQIESATTHGCEQFKENKNKVTSKENHEISGGVLKDLIKKARPPDSKRAASTLRGDYDEHKSRDIFNEEGLNVDADN